MPPIPVHIDDPITPTKKQAITPQTSEAQADTSSNPTTTTSAQNIPPAYPAARPGAAAFPAPTPNVPRPQYQPTQTTQSSFEQNGPPPPQPGAIPVPFGEAAPMTASTNLPPPPKPGEAAKQRQTTMPAQMNVPPPQLNYAPTHTTTTAHMPPSPASSNQHRGPTTLNFGAVSAPDPPVQPPPGYHQNAYAQDLTPAQRSSLEHQERRESGLPAMNWDGGNETAESMWNTVKGWANVAGKTLAETEESVWKRINGQ